MKYSDILDGLDGGFIAWVFISVCGCALKSEDKGSLGWALADMYLENWGVQGGEGGRSELTSSLGS